MISRPRCEAVHRAMSLDHDDHTVPERDGAHAETNGSEPLHQHEHEHADGTRHVHEHEHADHEHADHEHERN